MMMNHSSSPPMIPTLATNVSPWLIWATNLDARFTEQSMVDFFMKFAPIVNAGVLRNPIHGRSIRAGWVTLLCDRDTVISALSEVTSCQTGGIRSQWALATFSCNAVFLMDFKIEFFTSLVMFCRCSFRTLFSASGSGIAADARSNNLLWIMGTTTTSTNISHGIIGSWFGNTAYSSSMELWRQKIFRTQEFSI